MKSFGVLTALGIAVTSHACYNDIDTNLIELRDNLNVTHAVVGRFTIYPPSYYKKRIEIQSAILKKNPNDLDAYDNIAVAYDRIGDSDNALRWIQEKRKHLANAPKQHLYSTEANEGTILIVRWIRGHKEGDVTDAVASEKHIAKALEINPDAHFGREYAQLYCIQAMIQVGKTADWMTKFTPALLEIAEKEHAERNKLRFGIAGMMVLGAAWKLPPLIQSIADLVPDDEKMAYLCTLRLAAVTKKEEFQNYPLITKGKVNPKEKIVVTKLFINADQYQKHRNDWIEMKLAEGKHPDNDPSFWKEFVEIPPVPESEFVVHRKKSMIQSETGRYQLGIILGCGTLIGAAVGYYIYCRRKFR